MKRILFLAAATAAVMSSCSKNEITPDFSEGNEINFGIYSSTSTRAEDTTTETLETEGVGLFGYFQDGNSTTQNPAWAATMTPNFMFNKELTDADGDGAWIYNPVNYWSNDAADSYSFFAYGPYADGTTIAVSSANNTAGAPVITYTMPDVTADAPDFVAGQFMNTTKAASAASGVAINLKHQLTRIGFSARSSITGTAANGSDQTNIVVKSIEITDGGTLETYKSADYTFATVSTDGISTVHVQDGTWGNFGAEQTLSFAALLNKDNPAYGDGAGTDYTAAVGKEIPNNTAAYTPLFIDGGNQFLIPPSKLGLQGSQTVEITIVYDIVTEDALVQNGYTFSTNQVKILLPTETLAQGKAYNYQITFTLTEVKITPAVVDWDTNATTATGTETVGVPTTI